MPDNARGQNLTQIKCNCKQVVSKKQYTFCLQYYEKNTKSRITKTPFLEGLLYWLP